MERTEMTTPNWERGNGAFVMSITVIFTVLSVLNIKDQIAVIPSIAWLSIVVFFAWSHYDEDRGIYRHLIDGCCSFLASKKFVLVLQNANTPPTIRFGHYLFGCRIGQLCVRMDKIECVDWSTGQATFLAGEDMGDWSVSLQFSHDIKKERKHGCIQVSPASRKENAQKLGLAFVDFLNDLGASLVRDVSTHSMDKSRILNSRGHQSFQCVVFKSKYRSN
jgi:hypothetical protein